VTAVADTAAVTGANLAYAAVAYIVKQTVVDTWGSKARRRVKKTGEQPFTALPQFF